MPYDPITDAPTFPVPPIDPITEAKISQAIKNSSSKSTVETSKQESNENVQDVKPGEDIVKLGDNNSSERWTDAINSGEYSSLNLHAYKIYETKTDDTADSLFEISIKKPMYVQDSPIGGASEAGSVKSGDSYVVNGIALDADFNEWYRIEVDGQVKWISAEGITQNTMSFKDTEEHKDKDGNYESYNDQQKYEHIKETSLWQYTYQDMLDQNFQLANYINSLSASDTIESAFGETDYTIGSQRFSLVSGYVEDDEKRTYLNYPIYMRSMNRVMGLPPQWSSYVDPNVDYVGNLLIGRRYSQIILSNPTIISLCPGKLSFSKGVVDNLMAINWNNISSESLVSTLQENGVDMLWKFEEVWDVNYGGYLSYVNNLCRYAVECLSTKEETRIVSDGSAYAGDQKALRDRPLPLAFGSGSTTIAQTPLSEMLGDWVGYSSNTYSHIDMSRLLGSTVMGSTVGSPETTKTLWSHIKGTAYGYFHGWIDAISSTDNSIRHAFETGNQNHFVHFAVNGQANVRESFSTETRSSSLESLIGSGVSDTIKDLSFIVGAGFASDTDVSGDLNNLKNAVDTKYNGLGNILNVALDVVKGGTVAWPQLVGDVSWGREYTFNIKFISPYGDTESRFLNTIMPYICLMCLWLPKQVETAVDMYTWPFVVQAYAQGIFACPAGVITNVEVTHGGGEETGWTGSGQQTEIDVSFSITPLHHKLSMSNGNFFFLKNVAMQNYMGTVCGIDLTIPQTELIKETSKRIFQDWVTEQPARIEASIASRIHDSGFAQFLSFFTNKADQQ